MSYSRKEIVTDWPWPASSRVTFVAKKHDYQNRQPYLALSWQVPPTPPAAGLPLQARPGQEKVSHLSRGTQNCYQERDHWTGGWWRAGPDNDHQNCIWRTVARSPEVKMMTLLWELNPLSLPMCSKVNCYLRLLVIPQQNVDVRLCRLEDCYGSHLKSHTVTRIVVIKVLKSKG